MPKTLQARNTMGGGDMSHPLLLRARLEEGTELNIRTAQYGTYTHMNRSVVFLGLYIVGDTIAVTVTTNIPQKEKKRGASH